MTKIFFKKVKNEKGIAGQDLIIAIFILAMFLTFLLTVYGSIRKLSYDIRMNERAANAASKIAQKINSLEYDDEFFSKSYENISQDDLSKIFNITDLSPKIYRVNITINNLQRENDNSEYDLTKEVYIQVKYNLKGNFEKADATEIKLSKSREIARLEDDIENIDTYKPIVVKDINTGKELNNSLEKLTDTRNVFIITDKNDENWKNYSYFDKFLCCMAPTDKEEGEITFGNAIVWVPRFAMYNQKIVFLYKDTNYPIVPIYAKKGNEKIITGYTVDRSQEFKTEDFAEGEKGKWAGITRGGDNYDVYYKMFNALSSNNIYLGN